MSPEDKETLEILKEIEEAKKLLPELVKRKQRRDKIKKVGYILIKALFITSFVLLLKYIKTKT